MDKKALHHIWTRLREVRPWYFLVLALLSGTICIFALRANNEHMIGLRDTVYQTDKANGNIEQALQNLRDYVSGHMNTDLAAGPGAVHPPIQLKYTYDRLVSAEQQRVSAVNSHLYTDAQTYCQQLIPNAFYGYYREPCINNYVTTRGAKTQAIPKNLYEFDFVAPKWSPDLAGWSLVLTVVSVLLALVIWISEGLIRRELRQRT